MEQSSVDPIAKNTVSSLVERLNNALDAKKDIEIERLQL